MTDAPESIYKLLIEFHKRFHGAKKTGFNPHFKTEHFTLQDVNGAIAAHFGELGLLVAHRIAGNELITSIFTADGQELSSALPLPETSNPQATGSAITYYKRYNLCALLNISEADDDGEAAAIDQQRKITGEQAATIKEYLDALAGHIDMPRFWKAAQAETVEDIPLAKFQPLINHLKKAEQERLAQ